jgi:hypothetical protein
VQGADEKKPSGFFDFHTTARKTGRVNDEIQSDFFAHSVTIPQNDTQIFPKNTLTHRQAVFK